MTIYDEILPYIERVHTAFYYDIKKLGNKVNCFILEAIALFFRVGATLGGYGVYMAFLSVLLCNNDNKIYKLKINYL